MIVSFGSRIILVSDLNSVRWPCAVHTESSALSHRITHKSLHCKSETRVDGASFLRPSYVTNRTSDFFLSFSLFQIKIFNPFLAATNKYKLRLSHQAARCLDPQTAQQSVQQHTFLFNVCIRIVQSVAHDARTAARKRQWQIVVQPRVTLPMHVRATAHKTNQKKKNKNKIYNSIWSRLGRRMSK